MKNLREEFMGLLRIIRKTFCRHSWKYFIKDTDNHGCAGLRSDVYYRECDKCNYLQVYLGSWGSWVGAWRFEETETDKPPELRKHVPIVLIPYKGKQRREYVKGKD